MHTHPWPIGGIWIQWDNQMELRKNNTALKIVFEELLSVYKLRGYIWKVKICKFWQKKQFL